MKTYAEAQNEAPFDWNEFLNKPRYTKEEADLAAELASSWVTCACGNQCDRIPRHEINIVSKDIYEGQPKDKILAELGVSFYTVICTLQSVISYPDNQYTTKEQCQNEAKEVLKLIEEQSSFLLREASTVV